MGALKRLSSERGAELVEFALTFPLLLLVVLGIIDIGLIVHRYEVLTNAAREGARVRVLPGYADAEAQARVVAYLQGTSLSGAVVPVVITQRRIPAGSQCIDVIDVGVSYNHSFMFLAGIGEFFGSTFGTKTINATASMRTEMQAGGGCSA